MSPTMMVATTYTKLDDEYIEYQKGVKHLCEKTLLQVPNKYILPIEERPNTTSKEEDSSSCRFITLPTVDLAELKGLLRGRRAEALKSLATACEQYGFFQLVNHGIEDEVLSTMIDVSTRFFDQPLEERAKYMSADMASVVRCGTSFNQSKDKVFCWRDFLKLSCQPLSQVLHHCPSSPADMRNLAAAYAKETKQLFLTLMQAILETLGAEETLVEEEEEEEEEDQSIMSHFEAGSQLMVVNCYPPCPEPELTLGIPPHSDYGFLTLLLQDQVEGLQIQHQQDWVTVKPIPNSFVVNVGDHLEIFSNGKYKSVVHRALVNPNNSRISVATLHSLPSECTIKPNPNLIDEEHPSQYLDTDFNNFLEYISSCEPKMKNFLESRKVANNN